MVRLGITEKVVLIVVLFAAVIISLVFIGLSFYIEENMRQMEAAGVQERSTAILNEIDTQLHFISLRVRDWSQWDDMYYFVDYFNRTVEDNYLTPSNFRNLDVNAIIFLNASGKVVFARAVNLTTLEEIPVPEELLKEVADTNSITNRYATSESTGIIDSGNPPDSSLAYISAHPLLRSDGSGPPNGVLIFAKMLNYREINTLRGNDPTIAFFVNVDEAPPEDRAFLSSLPPTTRLAYRQLNASLLRGYTILYDIDQKDKVVVADDLPRDYFNFGRETGRQVIWLLLLVEALLIAVLVFVLNYVLLSRLGKIGQFVKSVKAGNNLSARLAIEGSDELSSLAESINGMLAAIAEAQAKELAAREEVGKAKTNFLNMVSHELKTPLTAMLAHLDVLDSVKHLSKESKSSVEAIRRNASNLRTLIENLLELSRIDAGKFELMYSEVDVGRLVDTTVKDLQVLVGRKKLRVEGRVTGKLKLYTDENRVREVLINLIGNAVKFTEVGFVLVEAKRDKDSIVFSVRDTGVGIPPGEEASMFGKFYQVDSSISRKYGGSGLGLAMSQGIVEKLGGKIWYESKLGKGTTFFFTIPATRKAGDRP